MVSSLNYAYDHGELSNTQKQAIITLLEKKDKDKKETYPAGDLSPLSMSMLK